MLFDNVELPFARHRAYVCVFISSAQVLFESARLLNNAFYKLLRNAFMHVATLDRCASLTGITERAPDRSRCCCLNVSVFQDNHRVFPAKLQYNWRQSLRSTLSHALARSNAPREHDLINARFNERRACPSISCQYLQQSFIKPCAPEHVANL